MSGNCNNAQPGLQNVKNSKCHNGRVIDGRETWNCPCLLLQVLYLKFLNDQLTIDFGREIKYSGVTERCHSTDLHKLTLYLVAIATDEPAMLKSNSSFSF